MTLQHFYSDLVGLPSHRGVEFVESPFLPPLEPQVSGQSNTHQMGGSIGRCLGIQELEDALFGAH